MQLQQVERISTDARSDVARDAASPERPLVITGSRAAAQQWTVEALRGAFGTLPIPVRKTDDEFEAFFGQDVPRVATQTLTVSEYLDVTQSPTSAQRPPYAGNISIFNGPAAARQFERLVTDCHFPHWSLPYTNDEYRLWLGAAGQRSTIHNDPYHNFNAQLIGTKRFVIFAPDQHTALHPAFFHPGLWASPIDPQKPDLNTYPDFAEVRGFECELTAGDVLLIPRFWWHYVEAMTFAVNVNRWISAEPGQAKYWHQQRAARRFISFESILDRTRQRFDALPPQRQESDRAVFDTLRADLLRLMAEPL